MLTEAFVREIAAECGLALVGILSREQVERSLRPQLSFLAQWQHSGFAGEMGFMNRSPELFASLGNFLPNAQSLIVVALPYLGDPLPPAPHGFGRVARYAWGQDYHIVLRDRLESLAKRLVDRSSGLAWRAFSDAVPLLERALGSLGGLGFIGKNSLLIRPGVGSYFFLGELLLTHQVAAHGRGSHSPSDGVVGRLNIIGDPSAPGSGCGRCESCIVSCPTEAFSAPGVLDSRKCISYLTIEKRGEFNDWERSAVSDWIFGCDVCQEVCPFNAVTESSVVEEFLPSDGVGPYLLLQEVLSIDSESSFRKQFRGSAVMRTKREGLLRNACAVAVNTRCFELIDVIGKRAACDTSELIRRSAHRALLDLEVEAEGVDRVRIRSLLGGLRMKEFNT